MLENDMIRMQTNKEKNLYIKIRKLAKRRDALSRELAKHNKDMKGYGKKIQRYTKR